MADKVVKFTRRFTEEQRIKYVNEVLESGSNILIAKKYDLHQGLLTKWVSNYRKYGQTLKPKEPKCSKVIPNYKKEYKKAIEKIDDLELKVKILEDLLKKNPL
jgi:transposase